MKAHLFFIATLFVADEAFLLVHPSRSTPTSILMSSTSSSDMMNIDKNVYRPEKVQEEFDTVVIGSGIGGLTAACLLAQQGLNVCVLEQHYVAGGAMHTFKSKGYRFATGIHYVGEMGEDDDKQVGKLEYNAKKLLDSITPPNDPVVWDKMNDHFETAIFGDPWCRHEIVAGEEAQKASLKKRFPKEDKAIDKYFAFVKKARRSFQRIAFFKAMPLLFARVVTRSGMHRLLDGGFHKWSQRTTQQVLEKLTKDKELQALLAYNWGDYGVTPDRSPFVCQAFAATHYLNGAYYPNGGPAEITKRVCKMINNCGGKVLVSAPVKRIMLDKKGGKVEGVEMMDGNKIKAKKVVSDAGFINTFTKLLPPDTVNMDFAKDDRATYGKLHPSTTGINLFVGLKGDHKSLHLPESQYWIYPSNELSEATRKIEKMSLDEGLKMDPRDFSPIFVGIPSTKDKSWSREHPDKTGLEIIAFVPYHWFKQYESFNKEEKTHGSEYETVKRQLAEKVWARVSAVYQS
jgi:all-trans-retinol 13,14-reductase